MKAAAYSLTYTFRVVCTAVLAGCTLVSAAVLAYAHSPSPAAKPVVSLSGVSAPKVRIKPPSVAATVHLPGHDADKPGSQPVGLAVSAQSGPAAGNTAARVSANAASAPSASCEMNSAYPHPAALDLSNAAAGLNVQDDERHYYSVGGQTPGQVRRAFGDCHGLPAVMEGPYHATTRYTVNWTFVVSPLGNSGSCRLDNIRVGVHINQILPVFPDAQNNGQLAAYRAALQAHEDGHKTITIDHANRLTDALRNTPALPCAMLRAQTDVTTQSYLQLINGANASYDSRTGHGATQGAVL